MRLEPGSHFLFIGDSITDCGRGRGRLGWESDQHLGSGYVSLVHAAINSAYPNYGIRILNLGVNGDTVRDLLARWASDVLALSPSWLSIMIGINDVWHHFGSFREEPPISLEEFGQSLAYLVQQIRSSLDGLVLMTPYYLELNPSDPMRSLMDQFGQAVRQTALVYRAIYVDTQEAFDEILPDHDPYELAPDKVHVGDVGHTIIARAVLNGLGVDWIDSSGASSGAD